MNLKTRIEKLESLLPRETPYGDIYDFLFAAEQTIPGPPGSSGEDEALQRLGNRETFVNDRRID